MAEGGDESEGGVVRVISHGFFVTATVDTCSLSWPSVAAVFRGDRLWVGGWKGMAPPDLGPRPLFTPPLLHIDLPVFLCFRSAVWMGTRNR